MPAFDDFHLFGPRRHMPARIAPSGANRFLSICNPQPKVPNRPSGQMRMVFGVFPFDIPARQAWELIWTGLFGHVRETILVWFEFPIQLRVGS